MQRCGLPLPVYKTRREGGTDHQPLFSATVQAGAYLVDGACRQTNGGPS